MNNTRTKQLHSKVIAKEDYQGAMQCLYKVTKQLSGSVESLSMLLDTNNDEGKDNLAYLQNLQLLAFNAEQAESISFSQQDGEQLFAALIQKIKKPSRWQKREGFKFKMQLNPERNQGSSV